MVFVGPLCRFGFCSQLKTGIDRFYSPDRKHLAPRQAALLSTPPNTAAEPNVPLSMTGHAYLTREEQRGQAPGRGT